MIHLYPELDAEARQAIAAMQDAARRARFLHARAELLRHMHTTAAKPGANVDTVVHEWLQAWNMTAWPEVEAECRRFTVAILDYAAQSSDATDAAIRESLAALEAALVRQGTTLSDQMALRSRCAHGWWGAVVPVQPGTQPFWADGCPADCL